MSLSEQQAPVENSSTGALTKKTGRMSATPYGLRLTKEPTRSCWLLALYVHPLPRTTLISPKVRRSRLLKTSGARSPTAIRKTGVRCRWLPVLRAWGSFSEARFSPQYVRLMTCEEV